MRKLCFLLSLEIFLLLSINTVSSAEAGGEGETGTVIVTYKTDSKGERLNRIRFRLKGKGGLNHSLYPKGKAFVEDPEGPSRMIVIEHIPIGHYTLQFLVPNTDCYFQEVSPREIIISDGDVVKIDQQIKPIGISRGNESKSIKPQKFSRKKESSYIPIDIVKEGVQKVETTPKDKTITAREVEIPIKPSHRETNEAKGFGKLIISYDLQTPNNTDGKVKFRLINSNGRITTHPQSGKDTEIPLKSGKMVMIRLVPVGDYSLEFFAENSEEESIHTISYLHIDANKTKSIQESLTYDIEHSTQTTEDEEVQEQISYNDNLELSVTANIPTAIFSLENIEENLSLKGKGRLHTFEGLPPGKYFLSFESSDPFFVPPESITIELSEGQDATVEKVFQTLGKLKILSNINAAEAQISDIDDRQNLSKIEITEGMGTAYLPESEYHISFKTSDPARKPPHPIEVKIRSLQTKEVNVYFELGRGGMGVNISR